MDDFVQRVLSARGAFDAVLEHDRAHAGHIEGQFLSCFQHLDAWLSEEVSHCELVEDVRVCVCEIRDDQGGVDEVLCDLGVDQARALEVPRRHDAKSERFDDGFDETLHDLT